MSDQPTYRSFGPSTVLVEWNSPSAKGLHEKVLKFTAFLREHFQNEVAEVVPAYRSLAIFLKPEINQQLFIDTLEGRNVDFSEIESKPAELITIPVCYEPEFAPDLERVAGYHDMSIKEVVRLHTIKPYKVYFLGFLPGFPYLGGLSKALHTPRMKEPKPVSKGAVGIGGAQTGIYPVDSPGGWNIIGRTPLDIFDIRKDPPSFIAPGDFIQFQAVNKTEFELIQVEVKSDTFTWRKEVYHD